jgi:diguanylate cyclase
MAGIFFDFVLIVFVGVAGVAAGWWVCSGQVKSAMNQADGNREATRKARVALAQLQELAVHVANEVGEHSTRVQEINDELTSGTGEEAECVVEAVAKIIDTNRKMQQELQVAEDRLQEQAQELESRIAEALTDALTKLANRRAFDEEMIRRQCEAQRHGRRLSVMMFDVDHFKKFNDTHGHQAGDDVLRGVARMLRRTCRDMDIVCRYGGEEFAVILPGTGVEQACVVADRARKAIEKEVFYYEQTGLHVTMSAGVAEILPGENVDTVVNRADEALYASKGTGRNCCHWHDGRVSHLVASTPPSKTTQQAREAGQPSSSSPVPPPDALAQIWTFGRLRDCVAQLLDAQEQGGPLFCVMLADIDDYPQIVARYGEHAGDLTIRALGTFLKAAMGTTDHVARYNSQIFALLMPAATVEHAVAVSERLRQAVTAFSAPVADGQLRFVASIGIAQSQPGDDVARLFDRAEEALFSAGAAGDNQICTQTPAGLETIGWSDATPADCV